MNQVRESATDPLIEQRPLLRSRRNKASIISKLFFGWVFNTISIASKGPLEYDMIEDLQEKDTSSSRYNEFREIFQNWKKYKYGLSCSLVLTSKFNCACIIIIKLIQVGIDTYNPVLVKTVIDYLEHPTQDIQKGVLLICGIVLMRNLTVLCNSHALSIIRIVGYDWMTLISMALLSKSMNVNFVSNKQHSNGQVLNFFQTDAMKLQWIWLYLSEVILMPFQIGISIYLTFKYIGISFLGGLTIIILIIIFNIFIGKMMIVYQSKLLKAKDVRTKCANEIFSFINFIKINAFEEFFREKLTELRNKEIKTLKTRFLISCLNIFSVFLSRTLILNATLIVYVALGNSLTPGITFAVIGLFNLLQTSLLLLPGALNAIIEADISLRRIHSFLSTTELMNDYVTRSDDNANQYIAISIKNGNFTWQSIDQQLPQNNSENNSQIQAADLLLEPQRTLKDIEITIQEQQFIIIVGDTGSGKSSLLLAMLGEMNYQGVPPQVQINGSIAYVSQRAWIQNTTVKENILFGKKFDQQRYDQSLYYSSLKDDLKQLIKGDQTMIGEKGINLSGGQKARVTLARAIYSDSEIYLLDDPISAVDVHVGKFIMHECLNGYLKHKTRILVTHALNYCQFADQVYLMEGGSIIEQGTFESIRQQANFRQLYDKFYQDNQELEEGNKLESKITQLLDNQQNTKINYESSFMEDQSVIQSDEIDELMLIEDRTKGGLAKNTVKEYFQLNHGYRFMVSVIILMGFWVFSFLGSNFWVAHWFSTARYNKDHNIPTNNYYYLLIYSAFSFGYSGTSFIRSWSLVIWCSNTANLLHNKVVSCLIFGPLCKFFQRVPLGRILNRLTKDQNILDYDIHTTINGVLVQSFQLMANAYLNIRTSSYYVTIPIIIYFSGCWYIQRIYMAAARELYRLESMSRSPILSYFGQSISGLQIIRGFQVQASVMNRHAINQDLNRKIFLEQIATNAWFQLVLGLSSFIVNVSALVFCLFYSKQDPAFAGLLMTYASSLDSNISLTVQCLATMENSLICFERCNAYSKIKPEKGYEAIVNNLQENQNHKQENVYLPNWPQQGEIEFKNYSVQYREGLPDVLQNINFTVKAGEKVAIVGSTGAGKSTITLSSLRILEGTQGQILIDNVDISTVSLKQLRESITMIMQDSTVFDGSIRENIDPLQQHSDQKIIDSINQCCLNGLINNDEGLNTQINESGDNLSAGQKQLICIARATLKRSQIVLIDEATANIDIETEQKIQEVIKNAFTQCTVVTIAHRINTILHCDKYKLKLFIPLGLQQQTREKQQSKATLNNYYNYNHLYSIRFIKRHQEDKEIINEIQQISIISVYKQYESISKLSEIFKIDHKIKSLENFELQLIS